MLRGEERCLDFWQEEEDEKALGEGDILGSWWFQGMTGWFNIHWEGKMLAHYINANQINPKNVLALSQEYPCARDSIIFQVFFFIIL